MNKPCLRGSPLFLSLCLALLFLACCACACAWKTPTLRTVSSLPMTSCAGRFDRDLPRLLAQQGLSETSLYFPPGEALGQAERYPGRVCPQDALRLSISALLSGKQRESLSAVRAELGPPSCDEACLVNRESSLLGIVADHNSLLANRLLPRFPHGANVRDHWVFFLLVSDLDEHGYWASVTRDGGELRLAAQN